MNGFAPSAADLSEAGSPGSLTLAISLGMAQTPVYSHPVDVQASLHTPDEQSLLALQAAHACVVVSHVLLLAAQSSLLKHSTHPPVGPHSGVGGDVDTWYMEHAAEAPPSAPN